MHQGGYDWYIGVGKNGGVSALFPGARSVQAASAFLVHEADQADPHI